MPAPPSDECMPSYKRALNGSCIQLTNEDVMRSLHFMASPVTVSQLSPESNSGKDNGCKKRSTIQGMTICEDYLPSSSSSGKTTPSSSTTTATYGDCYVLSIVSSIRCNHYGSLEFEKELSKRGCKVDLYHFTMSFSGNSCEYPITERQGDGKSSITGIAYIPEYPNIRIIRRNMWAKKHYNAFYKEVILPSPKKIDIMKIQAREGVKEDLDGVQFSILSDLFLYKKEFAMDIKQIVFTASINLNTMIDNVGREAENAWNMYGSLLFLKNHASFNTRPEEGRLQPMQYADALAQAEVDPSYSYYHHSFLLIPGKQNEIEKIMQDWAPKPPKSIVVAQVPHYCRVPTNKDNEDMQKWIKSESNARCHPTRLWVPCERSRTYDPLLPCPQELYNHLAEDYAAMKGWCDFTSQYADVPPLIKVDSRARKAFERPPTEGSSSSTFNTKKNGKKIRLAFLFTLYADESFVKRLLSKLYDVEHYYLLHVDPAGSSKVFQKSMKTLAEEYNTQKFLKSTVGIESGVEGNMFISDDVPIVYGASTATILLSKCMSWFDKNAKHWDYFVPVTGSDYPLVPLKQMEKILTFQNPPMPFVMAWTAGTSTHMFRLSKTVPEFEFDSDLVASLKAVSAERGRVLGAVPMEYRSTNFGPPLFCNNKRSFYHLDNRRNKSSTIFDTQWLFPRDKVWGRGRAFADWDPIKYATPSFDNVWRIWKKSDPATTGAYDRESVDYIVNSEEGRKYYHFFKQMLLGSEEHYYASLLYNWPRTQSFVQSISAQTVWNTWELGLWEQNTGFQTHTHFLTPNEWKILVGMSRRGMFFARKFNSKKTPDILDMIDAYIHHNKSTDSGTMWPGFFDIDTSTYGKTWVAAYRRNISALNKRGLPITYETLIGKKRPF